MKKEELREIIHHFKPEEDIEFKVLECLWEYYDLLCTESEKSNSRNINCNGKSYEIIDYSVPTVDGKKNCEGCDFYEKNLKDKNVYIGDASCQWCEKNPLKVTWNDSISGTSDLTAHGNHSVDYLYEGMPYGVTDLRVGKTSIKNSKNVSLADLESFFKDENLYGKEKGELKNEMERKKL